MRRYRLYGYINMFGIIPDFMYPVYYLNKEFFFAHGDDFFIQRFFKIKKDYLNEIQQLPEWYGQVQRQVGNEQIYIYVKWDGDILLGTGYGLVKRMIGMNVDQIILQKALEEFTKKFGENECKNLNPSARYYATGRRKTAVARVFLSAGKGKILINKKTIEEYFGIMYLNERVLSPLKLTGTENDIDLYITVKGGGISGQAEAVRHGIAQVLIKFDVESRKLLKDNGYLTRDSRMKERKKVGLRGARRKHQSSKR